MYVCVWGGGHAAPFPPLFAGPNNTFNDKNPSILYAYAQMHILDPLKYVKWSCLQQYLMTEKMLTNFLKDAITDIDGFLNAPLKSMMMICGWTTLTSQCPLKNDHKRQQICQIRHEKCRVVRPVFQVCSFYTS